MTAEIIPLRDSGLSLQDIVGQLRALADRIEAGTYDEVRTCFVIIPVNDAYPRLMGYGDIDNKNDPIIQLELAKLWLLTHLTER